MDKFTIVIIFFAIYAFYKLIRYIIFYIKVLAYVFKKDETTDKLDGLYKEKENSTIEKKEDKK